MAQDKTVSSFQWAPFTSDDLGRRFEREAIPSTDGVSAEALRSLLTTTTTNLVTTTAFDYDKAFAPDRIKSLVDSRKQVLAELNDVVQRMPSGLPTRLKKFGGDTVGFVTDPLNAATSVAAPELIGTKSVPLLNALAERSALASRVVKGTVEGAAIMTPSAVSSLTVPHPFNDDYDALDAIQTIGFGAVFGGGIGGAIHFGSRLRELLGKSVDAEVPKPVQPITDAANKQAMEAAIGQLASGKRVDVEAIIKQGFNDQRPILKDPENIAMLDKSRNEVARKLIDNENDIDAAKKDLEIPEGRDAKELISKESPRVFDLASRLVDIGAKDEKARLPIERAFLEHPDIDEDVQNASQLLETPPTLMGNDEIDTLNNLRRRPEADIVNERLQSSEQELASLSEKPLKERSEKEQARIDELKKTRIPRLKTKLKRLERDAKTPTFDKLTQLHKLEDDNRGLREQLFNHEAALGLSEIAPKLVTGDDLKNIADKMTTPKGNTTFVDQDPFQEEVPPEDIPATLLRDDIEKVNRLKDEGLLKEDELNIVKEVDDELKRQAQYTKVIDEAADCLGRTIQ